MRNKNQSALFPWSAAESAAFDRYIAEQDARIRAIRVRSSFIIQPSL